MNGLPAVAVPSAAIVAVASPARGEAQGSTAFASVLDALPHATARARSAAGSAEGGDEAKPRRSTADPRATLESALTLNLPASGASTAPLAVATPANGVSETIADVNAAGAPATKAGGEGDAASMPSTKIAGAKLVNDRTFHAAPLFGAGGFPSGALAGMQAAPGESAAPNAPEPDAINEQGVSFGPNEMNGEASGVASDAFVVNRTKAVLGTHVSPEGVPPVDAPRPVEQFGRSTSARSLAATATSSEAARNARGDLHQSSRSSAVTSRPPSAPSREAAAARSDTAAPASLTDTGQPNAAPINTAADLPFGADAAAAAGAAMTPTALPGATATQASPTAAVAGPSVRASAPVREIDVDLAPGASDDLSMTMRLAGDRLSVVIRARSGESAGAMEMAREAITDRLAAIGQPLASLVIQQTSANAGETNHAKDSFSDSRDGSRGHSGQANDQRGDRRSGAPERR